MGLRYESPDERPQLTVEVRLNHITAGSGDDYSTLTVTDKASNIQILEICLTPKQLYDMLANRGTGPQGVTASWPSAQPLAWIGQKAWYFSRTLGYSYRAGDPAVHEWANKQRDSLGLHTAEVRAYNYGVGARWSVHSNSITEETAALYQRALDEATLPPESPR